jgi:hypothetical protein
MDRDFVDRPGMTTTVEFPAYSRVAAYDMRALHQASDREGRGMARLPG